PSTCLVVSAAASSPEVSGTLASSRYQSKTSSQAKWYSTSQILPNSKVSNCRSTWAITVDKRDKIHRSGTEYEMSDLWEAGAEAWAGAAAEAWAGAGAAAEAWAGAGAAAGTRAPLSRANRTAFQSLLTKLRDPAAQS